MLRSRDDLFRPRLVMLQFGSWPISAKNGYPLLGAWPISARIGYPLLEAWPISAKIGYPLLEPWPISAKIGHPTFGESTLSRVIMLAPIGAWPFTAEIGHPPIAAWPFSAEIGYAPFWSMSFPILNVLSAAPLEPPSNKRLSAFSSTGWKSISRRQFALLMWKMCKLSGQIDWRNKNITYLCSVHFDKSKTKARYKSAILKQGENGRQPRPNGLVVSARKCAGPIPAKNCTSCRK